MAGAVFRGSLLRDLVFPFLVSDSARFVLSFVAVGATSIFGVRAFGVDLALTRWSLSVNLAGSGLVTFF